jgi:hypothetical protein
MRGTKCAVGLAVLLAGGLGLTRAAQDEAYDLRGPAPKKGQVYHTTMKMTIKNADLTLKVAGQTLKLKQTMVVTGEEEEKVLAVEGRQVTRSQARVIKDHLEMTDDAGETEKHPGELEGEVIISERTGEGKWKHSLVDTRPTDKQKKELDKRLGPENDDELFPEGKVKVGHVWTVDAAAMKKFFGNAFTDIRGKLNQKFLRVEEVDGEKCAVIEAAGPIRGKMKDDDGDGLLDVELDLKATSWRSLKTGVEVRSKFEGRIRIAGKQKVDDVVADVTIAGPLTGEATTKLKE